MARRSQPSRLSWPITAEQLERMDQMFQELYDDGDNGSMEMSADQITSGTLVVARGGTGISSYTIGDIVYASATTTLSALADVATGNALISGGVAVAPSWGKIGLTTHVSGVLPVANGGTNIASYTIGDLLYASAAGVLSQLADVAAGSYLRSGGVATAPVWSTLTLPNSSAQGDLFISTAANAVVSLAKDANATRYLSNTGTSNNPAWAQVNLANGVSGTLPVGNGGTNNTTFTAYAVLCAGTTATGAFQNVSGLGSSGQVLTSAGASALPTWSSAGTGIFTVATSTSTGTVNDFAPGLSNNTVVRLNNATDLTINGLAGGVDGQVVVFVSIGAGGVFFAHQNAGSVAGNRFINFVTSGVTPLAAGVGTAVFVYDATTARWRLVEHEQGAFIARAFAAGNFTGNGAMTWTMTAPAREAYYLKGRNLFYSLQAFAATVGGTPNTNLNVLLPNSWTLVGGDYTSAVLKEAGVFEIGDMQTLAAGTQLVFQRLGAANHAAGATGVAQALYVELN